ncbi:MAG: class I SAM-dependent methyltransferase [Flavobacteriales bacterium]|nr:class I SAM-dependent methyltransferase [Flavobacteriales bacterium]
MIDNQSNEDEHQLNNSVIKRYFEDTKKGRASSVSMMTHEYNFPTSAAAYRLRKEQRIIRNWLDDVDRSGNVLDVGCGAGSWLELFAKRYKSVIGIDQSNMMVKAANEKLGHLSNVKIIEGDVRHDLPKGPFDLIFLGGLCMYLKDADVVELLGALKSRLSDRGVIILRESTTFQGKKYAQGQYQAVYRSVNVYNDLFNGSGPFHVDIQRNYGYTNLVTAEELVNLRRKWLPLLPKDSITLDSLTWWGLRAAEPISFWALPKILAQFNIPWPKLQNHFFRLRLVK